MRRLPSHLLSVAAMAVCVHAVLGAPRESEPRVVELKGFRYSEYYDAPRETRVKTRLQGAKAQPQPGGLVVVTGARLETFREDGSPELIMEAPECTHDERARTISSPGPLLVKMADGSFSIHGDGFHFQRTNSVLSISNNVETVALPDLLQERQGKSQTAHPPATPLQINSDQFSYSADEGLGVYRGNVRVAGTNLAVACGVLTLKLPVQERRLRSIEASDDVKMDYAGMNATGQKATYNVDTDIAEVTGRAAWSSEGREGSADKFTIDRTNHLVVAEGNARLRMPGQTLAAKLLPNIDAPATATTGAPGAAQSVQVHSATYELRTNMAVFDREVVVTEMTGEQAAGQLTCARLTALFSGTNQLDRLLAQDGVEITRGDNHLRARQAVYSATNNLLELQDNPSWQAGLREGKGREITVDTARNEMHVRGDALMKMPAESFSASMLSSGKEAELVDMAGQVAEIHSEEYFLRPEQAVFKGGVSIKHPQTMMACRVLTVDLPSQGGHVEKILADQKVTFDLVDRSGQRVKGSSDNAVYSYAVSGAQTNEQFQLVGSALVQSTNGVLQSRVIYYNRADNKVAAPNWKMHGTISGGGTNMFNLPKFKS